MTPADTGPLVASLHSKDKHHVACVGAAKRVSSLFVTTWPCVTEAMYLLGKSRGHAGQDALWRMIEGDGVQLDPLSVIETARMRLLMDKYKTLPMDLADASLVVMAETLGASVVFTMDSDFYVYRLANGRALCLVP